MGDRTISENVKALAMKPVLNMLDENPDTAFPKIIDWLEKNDKDHKLTGKLNFFKKIISNPDGNWYKLIKSLWTDIDDGVRQTLFTNFIVNANMIGSARQDKARAKYKCSIPWAILMDPTSACNLHCIGCWAADYGRTQNMSLETLDSIINQGTDFGTFMYIYTGGEPLVRKADIIKLCEMHPDCEFLAFTNSTLIDEAFADEMLRVKNFIPAISVEGFGEATDSRRGQGTYAKIVKAMEILKRKKLPFGVSCCYTSANAEVIGSEAYFDDLIAKGAKFAWFFTYIPVGVDAPTNLIATAEQREMMYHNIRQYRKTKELFTMDFWNDGEYVNGCIAGARRYLHINANGDIEPCAFIHYSDSNIYSKTLIQAFQSPLFMQYRQNQPFNKNLLRPCPLLDNNGKLADMVHASGADSTDLVAKENVDNLCGKCKDAAEHWEPVSDVLWKKHMEEKTAQLNAQTK